MKRASIWCSLYFEAIKKIRIAAVILMVFYIGSNAILFGSYNAMYLHSWIVNLQDLSTLSMLYIYPAGLILGLMSFSYLNKRKSSDFYHAIPTTRTKLYFASYAAAATWMAVSVALCYAVIPIMMDNGCAFNPYDLVLSAVYTFFATLMVFSAVIAGCSFTGTLFSNLAAAAIIVWLPTAIRIIIGLVFEDSYAFDNPDIFMFDPMANFATGILFSFMGMGSEFGEALYSGGYWAFNLLILALYTAGGMLIFRARRSEVAEHTAPSNKVQNIMATLLSTFFVFVLAALVITNEVSLFDEETALLLLIAFTVFMVYQVVAYRNLSKTLKTLPWLAGTAVVSLALCFGTQVVASGYDKTSVLSDNIDGVYIVADRYSYYYPSYSAQRSEEVNVSEPELNSIVANAINEEDYNKHYIAGILMDIDLIKGKDFTQTVQLTENDHSRINEILSNNEEYKKAQNDLPPKESIKQIRLFENRHEYFDVKADTHKIYESLIAENAQASSYGSVAYATPADTYVYDYKEAVASADIASLYVYGYEGLNSYLDEYDINPMLTPKTANMLLPEINAVAEEYKNKGELTYISLDVFAADGSINAANVYQDESDYAEIMQEFIAIIKEMKFANTSGEKMVRFTWEGRTNYDWYNASCWLEPTDEQFDALMELCDRLEKQREEATYNEKYGY